jgi:hypothetical protein
MNKSVASMFALVQFLALVQILLLGFVIIPYIWYSGESVVTSGMSDPVHERFRSWFAGNMHATELWVIGVGVAMFIPATVGSVLAWRAKE